MSEQRRRVRSPPGRIVQAYFLVAHVALLVGAVALAGRPELLSQFYYQPRTLAVVHLLTLGWITGSILGSCYALGPITWRLEMTVGRWDWTWLAVWAISVAGMATHFWIDEYVGMTWAAVTALAAIVAVGARVVRALATARIPAEHRLPIILAFANVTLAGILGVAMGLEKVGLLTVPGAPLRAVLAHAHLAALGWVLMVVVGAGYRLLPMFLPAPMPTGRGCWFTIVGLQAGATSLSIGLLAERDAGVLLGAAIVVAALGVLGAQLATMVRRRRQPPALLPTPDLTLFSTALAAACMVLAALCGLVLVAVEAGDASLRLASAYGVLGLLGFGQLVVGIGGRLLPLTVWLQEFVESGYQPLARPLHHLPARPLQAATVLGWGVAVPVLALGAYRAHPLAVRIGALALLAGALADAANRLLVVRRARTRVQ